ncbi:hypothetical protein LOZ39_004507 [Ophidiomyces ophidiicola]|uniref:Uncharacterized protein n=1 Tax=Ophidiomyces ophidiicola TaxID=1387563 RepID=A0ACB8V1M9_9EURO|nr:uncharacterized protein LOZ57_003481 [Ophidiomyces ophidiicola]KAI1909157.1 hypothetical protein LOZ61_005195 [Ophidiomyces ophidiicola]KAI1911424.1 hypothetical protein LOZ64_004753 [Ophidiomyces ophidiicola]KAI1930978.1 hypothetical protein LOZ60_000638 [Ophidiomyces ophidiicola]KAI1946711.1 hypothetical protein LOZ57_003481 [Ophidiomyces ophidiicola]KAI1954390.1 hypothetical protein LOZ59_004914 [Ophidiomyces ophidiicola]
MVLLIITPTIFSALESVLPSVRDELSLPAPVLNGAISHIQLIALSQKLSSHGKAPSEGAEKSNSKQHSSKDQFETAYSLNSLLCGTKLYISPPPPKPTPNPEYLALKARLQAEAQEKEYKSYLQRPSESQLKCQPSAIFSPNVGSTPLYSLRADDTLDDPITPSLVLNIFVSVLFTGFATYWALTNFRTPHFFITMLTFTKNNINLTHARNYPGSVYSQPSRVFISLLAALSVGVAEVVVYAAYLRKVDRAKRKEKSMVERKIVVGEVGAALLKKDIDAEHVEIVGGVEKEQIWGKGVNGGARRRIREKWNDQQHVD